jgi:hypothetical protein
MSIALQRADRTCRLVSWAPWPFPNSSLIGHCSVAFTGGWVVHDIPVFRTAEGGISVGTPTVAQLDGEGRVKLLPSGKRDYRSVFSFENNEARQRWRNMITAALAIGGITNATQGGNAP